MIFSLTVQIEFDKDIAADQLQTDLGKCYEHAFGERVRNKSTEKNPGSSWDSDVDLFLTLSPKTSFMSVCFR